MSQAWYVFHSHPHKEDFLWRELLSRGIEVFYPRIRVSPVNPRAKKVRPYFPGYLFICINVNEVGLSVLQWIPHSSGLVSFGGEPAVVPESLIQAIRLRVDEIEKAGGEAFDSLRRGDSVLIQDGPFEGYEAIFDVRVPGSERVRVLLKMLNDRNLPIEMDARQIIKKHIK